RVSLLDFAPTLAELVGLPVHPSVQGRSLLPFEGLDEDRQAFATAGDLREDAVLDGRWKLVEGVRGALLYDVEADPRETADLLAAAQPPAETEWLRGLLRQMRRAAA